MTNSKARHVADWKEIVLPNGYCSYNRLEETTPGSEDVGRPDDSLRDDRLCQAKNHHAKRASASGFYFETVVNRGDRKTGIQSV